MEEKKEEIYKLRNKQNNRKLIILIRLILTLIKLILVKNKIKKMAIFDFIKIKIFS